MRREKKQISICHFSDLHLLPDRPVPWHMLLSKRALGYANLKFNRGRTHKEEYLMRLIAEIALEKADMTVVTGDFTSLSLDFEFEKIGRMFRLGGLVPEQTLLVPGNHDRYTVLADKNRAFEKGMADWLPQNFADNPEYPVVKRLGHVCLLGLDTAVWRGPIRAAGAIDDASLARTAAVLASDEMKPLTKVIALHHPPFYRGMRMLLNYRTGFEGYERLIQTISEPAVILHGHTHVASRRQSGRLDIIGVPSASNNTGDESTQLAYNKYTFSQDGSMRAEAVRFLPTEDGRDILVCRVVLPDEY